MKFLTFILALFLGINTAYAVSDVNISTFTGSVVDTSAQPWSYASWTATLYNPSGGTPVYNGAAGCGARGNVPLSFVGQLDINGTFQNLEGVGRNECISPAGTSWVIVVSSLTSASPFILQPNLVATGTTTNLGAIVSAGLNPPIVTSSNLSYAYNPSEITNAVNGNGYVNTITNVGYLYNNGWIKVSGIGCTSTSVTGNVSFNNQVGSFQQGCLSSVGNPFAVSLSCPQAGAREIGNATTNPFTCTLGYSNGTPTQASLTDGTNTDTLVSPFTSGSLAFAYSSNTTFTANATASNLQTASATQSLTYLAREFGGVGTAGATGATASGTNAILVGATGTLASAGLGTQGSFGPYTPSNQSIYVLGLSNSCSFTSGGFQFPMNAPLTISFTNQYGSVVTMYLYQSTNLLNATFTLNGAC